MKPKPTLLLVLAIASIAFMAFLIAGSLESKYVCQEKKCCKKQAPDSSGGNDSFESSLDHFIVSTRK